MRPKAQWPRCSACGQLVTVLAEAPHEPGRHRWCSDAPGRLIAVPPVVTMDIPELPRTSRVRTPDYDFWHGVTM